MQRPGVALGAAGSIVSIAAAATASHLNVARGGSANKTSGKELRQGGQQFDNLALAQAGAQVRPGTRQKVSPACECVPVGVLVSLSATSIQTRPHLLRPVASSLPTGSTAVLCASLLSTSPSCSPRLNSTSPPMQRALDLCVPPTLLILSLVY